MREHVALRLLRRPGGACNRGMVLRGPRGEYEPVVQSADGFDLEIADRKAPLADTGESRLAKRLEVDVETIASGHENEPGRSLETRDRAAAMVDDGENPCGHRKVSFPGLCNRHAEAEPSSADGYRRARAART